MKPEKQRAQGSAPFRDGELLLLELRVAKRADMLWRSAGCRGGRDLIHWLQAENEIFERYFLFERPAGVMLARGRDVTAAAQQCLRAGGGPTCLNVPARHRRIGGQGRPSASAGSESRSCAWRPKASLRQALPKMPGDRGSSGAVRGDFRRFSWNSGFAAVVCR